MLSWLKSNPVPEVTVNELKSVREAEDAPVLIDVRTAAEYAQGHAPGAINIPLDQVAQRRGELSAYDGQDVYMICRSGARSGNAAKALIPMGVKAINVAGGTMAWIRAGFPVEK